MANNHNPQLIFTLHRIGGMGITQQTEIRGDQGSAFHVPDSESQAPALPNLSVHPRGEDYQELLNQVNDIVFRMTIQGNLTEVSPSVTQILGYYPDNLIGKNITHYLNSASLEKVRGEISNKITHPSESSRYELSIQARDGREVICDINSRLVKRAGRPPEILGIIRDTTDRHRMEDLIRASEHKFRDIYENAIEGIFQTSVTGEILSANNSFARMYGYDTPSEFLSQVHDISCIYANLDDRLRILQALNQYTSVQNVHLEVIRRDGEKRWISLNARMVPYPSGHYIEGSVVDITEEVLLKKDLEEKERIYRLLAENVSDVIWKADMEMRINYISPSVCRLRGYTPEEASLQHLHEVYTPDSLQTLLGSRRKGMADLMTGDQDSEIPHYLELAMYHRDGHIIWTETVISPIWGEDGRPIGLVGSIRDISARKQVELAHQEIEVRLKEAQQIAQIGNWEMNRKNGIITCSDEVYRILEVSPDAISGTIDSFITFIHPDERDEFRCRFLHLNQNSEFSEAVYRIVLDEGRVKYLHIRGRSVSKGRDEHLIVGTFQDITERMRIEDERKQLIKQIQRNMAELMILNDGIRNPLAIIEAVLEFKPNNCHEEVLTQISRIDSMVCQLDKRWAESEKIFSYLQKHYGIS